VRHLSPFEYLPAVPAAPFDLVPVLMELGLAIATAAVGLFALRRRDIAVA